MQAKRILETCLYVDDLQAAEAFYKRVLGLECFARNEGRHAFFRCGEQLFLIFNAEETKKSTGTIPPHGAVGEGHVGFRMEPEESMSWYKHLEKLNITIESEVPSENGYSAIYFRDPSGNSIELVTREWWDD
ncbi:MAG: VOC family protein [Chloroflexota bacterium]